MCGGRGTRLGGETEKPLHPIAGRPMVDRVVDALADSRIGTVYVVVSPHTPRTRSHLDRRRNESRPPDLAIVDAPGDGYVSDLQYAVEAAEAIEPPVLTVAADLPLLDGDAIDAVLDAARVAANGDPGDDGGRVGALTVCVPAKRKRELGVSADTASEVGGQEVVPAGINVVGGTESENGDGDDDASGSGESDDASGSGRRDGDADDDGDGGAVRLTDDVRIAVNVNYPSDVRIAEELIAGDDGGAGGSDDDEVDGPGATGGSDDPDGGSDRRGPDTSDPDGPGTGS